MVVTICWLESQKRKAAKLKGFWLIPKAETALSHELYHVL